MAFQCFFLSTVVALTFVKLLSGQYTGTGSTGTGCSIPMPDNMRVLTVPSMYYSNTSGSFFGDLMQALKEKTGIPYTITYRTDLAYGVPDASGQFPPGSMFYELINNRTDLIGCDLTITVGREALVDFLVPFVDYKLQLLVNTQFGIGPGVQYVIIENADISYLQKSKNATLLAMAANIDAGRPGSIVDSDEEGVAKVLSGNYAYVEESNGPRNAIAVNPGKLAFGGNLGTLFLSFAVRQGSCLREKLNLGLLQLGAEGLVEDLLRKYNVDTY